MCWKDPGTLRDTLSQLGCLSDGFRANSTPRSGTPLQVYKRASSCAWTRQNTLHSTFELSQCTWTGLMNLRFSFVLCWSVFQIRFTSLSTLKQTNVSLHTHWLHERKIPTVSLLKLSFYSTSRSLPSKWCILRNNKMLFLPLPLWWCPSRCLKSPLKRVLHVLRNTFYPSALRAGGVLSSRFGRAGGRAGGCQTCGTHISVTAWRIFSIRSSMELSRPVVVHCHGNLPICPIWACPWAKNLSNLPQIGSKLCGTHISETAGWIYPI